MLLTVQVIVVNVHATHVTDVHAAVLWTPPRNPSSSLRKALSSSSMSSAPGLSFHLSSHQRWHMQHHPGGHPHQMDNLLGGMTARWLKPSSLQCSVSSCSMGSSSSWSGPVVGMQCWVMEHLSVPSTSLQSSLMQRWKSWFVVNSQPGEAGANLLYIHL